MNNSEILLYQTEDGQTKIDVRLEEDTVWLTIEQMSELFQKSRSTINEHIINIYNEGELEKEPSLRKIGISDFSTKPTSCYNLDVVISEVEKHFLKQVNDTAKKLKNNKKDK
jgi:hypothetical protein